MSLTVSTSNVELTAREALSGIFASISLSAWIFFLVPQLLENRRNQSGDAVSLSFILIRFASDIFNLLGGIMTGIIPGLIAVAVDYCVSDVLLVAQVLYYGIRNRRREGKTAVDATIESLKGNLTSVDADAASGGGLLQRDTAPGIQDESNERASLLRQQSRRSTSRKSSSQDGYQYNTLEDPIDHLTEVLDERGSKSTTRLWLKDLGFVLAICIIAVVGWALAYKFGVWTPKPEESEGSNNGDKEVVANGAQILGYASAVLALGCRIPQIVKNWRSKSCEGLSILFFILSLVGNVAYGAGLLFHSTQKSYVIKNVPWLVGSLGTVVQDVIIFVQFHLYRKTSK